MIQFEKYKTFRGRNIIQIILAKVLDVERVKVGRKEQNQRRTSGQKYLPWKVGNLPDSGASLPGVKLYGSCAPATGIRPNQTRCFGNYLFLLLFLSH